MCHFMIDSHSQPVVNNDETIQGKWSIYERLTGTNSWSRIRSQAYKAKQEEYDNKGYAGINYERSHPFLVENSMIGGVVPKIYGKPCFYIPENNYSVNYHEDHPSTLTIDTRVLAGSEEATRNELYDYDVEIPGQHV